MHSDLDEAPSASALDARLALFGRDPTPGIVSVSASRDGRATIWRRIPAPPLSRLAGVTRVLGEGAIPPSYWTSTAPCMNGCGSQKY